MKLAIVASLMLAIAMPAMAQTYTTQTNPITQGTVTTGTDGSTYVNQINPITGGTVTTGTDGNGKPVYCVTQVNPITHGAVTTCY